MLDRLFDKALAIGGGTHTREDVVAKIKSGEFHCLHNEDAVVVFGVVQDPQVRFLHVFVVAGDFKRAMELEPQLIAFAQEQGCKFMTTSGRKGLIKRLPAYGWEPKYVTFRKDVPDV